jgi:hypothetical protein
MTLTRRDLLGGIAAGAALWVVPDGQALPASNLSDLAVSSTAELVPDEAMAQTVSELCQWEAAYRACYRIEHRARNQAMLQMFAEEDPEPARVDVVAAKVEAELGAAESLVRERHHQDVAEARGAGFVARRDGKAANENPHWPALRKELNYGGTPAHDRYMAWYAGWVQADPNLTVDGNPATRPRGYTPPVKGAPKVPRHGAIFT